ncbi:16S rRNA (guanine527-N7)-methyltransferase [Afifella marina DSM 2698]|uniref:Ribosomal RNA small subunit methyltransferase G n=1 Tax=Afifella marina DSM 2698 TaxID=1120955 RepID=A0A1G5NE70_AFIMA|nr:16S rRNA (guanine527-N7)-methyltransferase [Afifella marina DSM 2698]
MRPEQADASRETLLTRCRDLVTAETEERLVAFVELLKTWQRTHNLVSPRTIDEVWERHVGDSLQLVPIGIEQKSSSWLDIGSGAGFPGLIVAIVLHDRLERVGLVEANHKKAAFLRQAVRVCGLDNVTVHARRIEALHDEFRGCFDVVSARALAPLPGLLELAAPFLAENGLVLAMKGKEYVHEEAAASDIWQFDRILYPSLAEGDGTIAAISHLKRRKA